MKNITLVMMTCGETSEQRCLDAIASFKDQVEFFEVRNIYPQIRALNQMINGVQTEYFIPLDADMVLYEDAWDRISNAWRKHWRDPQWHSILFPLWDTLTERKILALKLMRTSVAKANLFAESCTPDIEHYQRLSKEHTCIHDYLSQRPIGDHVVAGRHFCYFKYRDVYQTYRNHNFEWDSGAFMGGTDLRGKAKAHFDFFQYKWIMTGNTDYLNCIAGMLDGIISPMQNKSKTLEKHEYIIDENEAIDAFWNWYLHDDCAKFSGGLLF